MNVFIMILICLIMLISICQFMLYTVKQKENLRYRTGISFELFYTLIIIYILVIIGFGMVYFLHHIRYEILIDTGQLSISTTKDALFRSLYFSGVTMLTIGYGDIIPIGAGRFIAVIQALIGYILPTTFILKLIHLNVEADRKQYRHSKWKKQHDFEDRDY